MGPRTRRPRFSDNGVGVWATSQSATTSRFPAPYRGFLRPHGTHVSLSSSSPLSDSALPRPNGIVLCTPSEARLASAVCAASVARGGALVDAGSSFPPLECPSFPYRLQLRRRIAGEGRLVISVSTLARDEREGRVFCRVNSLRISCLNRCHSSSSSSLSSSSIGRGCDLGGRSENISAKSADQFAGLIWRATGF